MNRDFLLVSTAVILLSAVFCFWINPRLLNPAMARLVPHVPGWMWPGLFAFFIVFGQWLRGGRRFGASPWVYEFGAALGFVLGSLLWIAKLRIGKGTATMHLHGHKAVNKTIDDEL